MKNGKRPTVAQKKFITAHGLNCEEWLVVKDTPELMELTHRTKKFAMVIPKFWEGRVISRG